MQDKILGENTQICNSIGNRIQNAGLWKTAGVDADDTRTHLVSPTPFPLNEKQVDTLNKLGKALLAFYQGVNALYLRSDIKWVKDYLDIGKPNDLIRQAAMKYHKNLVPGVIRPDILLTEDGFAITELDSVPGGMGHLDCLCAAYRDLGFDLIGSGMRDGFAAMIKGAAGREDPTCAIIVSDESIDYLPEMTFLAQRLREIGLRAYTVRPKEVIFTEDGLLIEVDECKERVDVIYRFFELFDLMNIPKSELVSYAARKKLAVVTPPYKHFFEEKMLLGLFHSGSLRDYWMSALGEEHYYLLKATFAPTFIMDNHPVPPHAEIAGFRWQGKPIRDWREIANGTQKDRRMILKPSGFSPLAWGARGVKVGHDMAQNDWADSVEHALASFDNSPYVLQPFQDTSLFGVKYYDESGISEMKARVRLCPYYFVNGSNAELGGVLATACPKNKKLIHGMVDAVLSPCYLQQNNERE